MKVEIFDGIPARDLKAVKAYAKAQRAQLAQIVQESTEKAQRETSIRLFKILETTVTYFDPEGYPAVMVTAKGIDTSCKGADNTIMVELFTALDETGTTCNIYHKV